MMDLKRTGKALVGNLKQKVGAVRQEVDDIMSQDSVKYVGNQVQTVGKGMKWLYTGIFHDVRPSVVYSATHQPEAEACKHQDVSTNVDVKVGVPGRLLDTDGKSLPEVPASAPLMTKDSDDDCQVKVNHFDVKPESQTYVNLINGESPNLARGNKEMVWADKLFDEDNIKEKKAPLSYASKLMPPNEEECSVSRLNTVGDEPFRRLLGHESVGVDDKHRTLNMERISAESLDSNGKFLTREKVTVINTFMDDIESPCDDSRVSVHAKLNALISCCEERMTKEVLGSPVFDGNFPPQKELACQSCIYDLNHVYSALKAYAPLELTSTLASEENIKEGVVDSSGSVYEGPFLCGQNIRTLNNLEDDSTRSTSFKSPFIQLNKGFSTELHDQGTVEKMVDLSSLPSLEGHQAKELSAKECKPIVESGFVFSDSFTISSETVLPFVENKMHKSFVSESPHKESLSEEQEVADMLLSGPANESLDDVSVSSMETIELSEKEKLESRCVIVDNTAVHALSGTWRKLSYKEMIQNAFTSRKKLAKEYKQLGIQFGDADIWQDQDSPEATLPSSTSNCKSIETDVTHDSEWEII